MTSTMSIVFERMTPPEAEFYIARSAKSSGNFGANFRFFLIVSQLLSRLISGSMDSGLRHRVGILDDNDDSRGLLRFWLEAQGFEVREYRCKADFIAGARQDKLDIGLVDLWLPDGSGLEVPCE